MLPPLFVVKCSHPTPFELVGLRGLNLKCVFTTILQLVWLGRVWMFTFTTLWSPMWSHSGTCDVEHCTGSWVGGSVVRVKCIYSILVLCSGDHYMYTLSK